VNHSLYISRNIQDVRLLERYCLIHNIHLTAISQIFFEKLDFVVKHPFDVVFFSSPRSIDFFINAYPLPNEIKIACVGDGTANHLKKMGYSIDFCGMNPGLPDLNARDFADWLGNRHVLFPLSDRSKEHMLTFVSPKQLEKIRVYKTKFESVYIPNHDVYIFSSPSNVNSFLERNKIPQGDIIAWGKSTEEALVNHGIQVRHTLKTSSETELINYLSLIRS
jgi:uroporphyrinogen-III synthase